MTDMTDKERLQRAELWGQLFEIATKRGVLAYLCDQGLIAYDRPDLQEWQAISTGKLAGCVIDELDVVDPNLADQMKLAITQLLASGYGLGWSCVRQWAQTIKLGALEDKTVHLWCPLTLPKLSRETSEETRMSGESSAAAFIQAFDLPASCLHDLAKAGQPARADFTLLVTGNRLRPGRRKRDHTQYLLVLEFSYHAQPEIPDYRAEAAHLKDGLRYAQLLESRGVFSQIRAELQDPRIEVSGNLVGHLTTFTGRDKPFYKVCQGAAYLDSTMAVLREANRCAAKTHGRVIAITPNGFESLGAIYTQDAKDLDPRCAVIQQMGNLYRRERTRKQVSQADAEANTLAAFRQLTNALPREFKSQVTELSGMTSTGSDVQFHFHEEVRDFTRPTTQYALADSLAIIQGCLAHWDDMTGWDRLPAALESQVRKVASRHANGLITLRDLHASAVRAGLESAQQGELTVLALEGNPGIGKTTAVRQYLLDDTLDAPGFLFIYLSPRVVINKDVTGDFAKDGARAGVVSMSTNAKLISNAEIGFKEIATPGPDTPSGVVDSVVVVEGGELDRGCGQNIWFINTEQELMLESLQGVNQSRKRVLNERDEEVLNNSQPGVLRTLGTGANRLLAANPHVTRLAITAAIQGYRLLNKGSTVDGLTNLFKNKADTPAGREERRAFAQRFPQVIVMLDEVAGDSAGVLFVHAMADWLKKQFIAPFGDSGESPFKPVLIIADASLGNEVVMKSYLESGHVAPEKVLVSSSKDREGSFSLAATPLALGADGERVASLHIMTNSFPAQRLQVDYHINLHRLETEMGPGLKKKSIPARIAEIKRDKLLASACDEICNALPGAKQVIFFAQDKNFLSALRDALCHKGESEDAWRALLSPERVAIIDSSVSASDRKTLVKPEVRDTISVFLMTSAASRGISFPMTTHIIAAMPRFSVESSLMEVAQLIYRGRGRYMDPDTGEMVSGDDLPRTLVMLVDDFYTAEDFYEDKKVWLRRASDLLTLLMLLRSTIHTRIKGDAGLRFHRLALVPVGLVGSEEITGTLAERLAEFLRESEVYIARNKKGDSDLTALLSAAISDVKALFGDYHIRGVAKGHAFASFTDRTRLAGFIRNLAAQPSLLVPPGPKTRIPENIHCVGPFWLEDWSHYTKQEDFTFSRFSTPVKDRRALALKRLAAISHGIGTSLPQPIRQSAKDVHSLISRREGPVDLESSTLKQLSVVETWLAFPAGYPLFLQSPESSPDVSVDSPEGERWKMALSGAFPSARVLAPVLPFYEGFPFVVSVGVKDPARLANVFDDRYFAASSELNLLNILLLNDPDS